LWYTERARTLRGLFALKKVAGGKFVSKIVRRRVLKGSAFRSSSSQDANGGCAPDRVPKADEIAISSVFLCLFIQVG